MHQHQLAYCILTGATLFLAFYSKF